ncbi:hypothetical protein MKL11_03875 [Methylobacterium sp. J-077]|nr:hypothetical protein [Methylobacterium sp. J-077]MCJ2121682.1 hypothetical protein [Methylobacterium sp. J-077]
MFSPGPIEPIRLEENAMSMKTLALAAALTFAITGSAFAQMSTGGGSAQSNMNNPGSVKSPSQKRMGGQRGMMGMRHMTHHRRHHMRRARM